MDASTTATIAAASVTGAGTIALSVVALLQLRRDRKRETLEKTPRLLLTGAPHSDIGGYRAELANLSPHALWLNGVYADWGTQANERLGLTLPNEDRNESTLDRAPLVPGGWVGLRWPFGMANPDRERRAEIVAEFYYAPTGSEVHRRAWRIHGVPHHALKVMEIPLPAWFVEWKEEVA